MKEIVANARESAHEYVRELTNRQQSVTTAEALTAVSNFVSAQAPIASKAIASLLSSTDLSTGTRSAIEALLMDGAVEMQRQGNDIGVHEYVELARLLRDNVQQAPPITESFSLALS